MPLTIKTLKTTVNVKTKRRESPLQKAPRPAQPSMEYAMPITDSVAEGGPDPNKTATQGKGPASKRIPISAKTADPNKVADRVFELMKREIMMNKYRGGFS